MERVSMACFPVTRSETDENTPDPLSEAAVREWTVKFSGVVTIRLLLGHGVGVDDLPQDRR
jgi:hypothetical protein